MQDKQNITMNEMSILIVRFSAISCVIDKLLFY